MPRYYRRRHTERQTRRGSVLPLVAMLVVALLLLLFLRNGKSDTLVLPKVNLPPLPNITIPITGLPQIEVPTVEIPITVVPGTLIPQIGIGGTPAPQQPAALGQRSKTNGCQFQGALPDAACTPGAVMNVNSSQICQSGYSSSVRDVPSSEKNQVYAEYGLQAGTPGQYEVDHLVPLELGGSNDIANLWPEPANPRPGFHEKDQLENYLHDQVCSGKLSLADAQRQIASNWLSAYSQMSK